MAWVLDGSAEPLNEAVLARRKWRDRREESEKQMSKRGRKRKSRRKGGANHGKRPNA
jgi:hypothetical protein